MSRCRIEITARLYDPRRSVQAVWPSAAVLHYFLEQQAEEVSNLKARLAEFEAKEVQKASKAKAKAKAKKVEAVAKGVQDESGQQTQGL